MRKVFYIAAIGIVLVGCASNGGETAAYPDLSDVKDRPIVALTPERSEELTEILIEQREIAQAFASLGYREEQTLANAIARLDAADAIPDPSLTEGVSQTSTPLTNTPLTSEPSVSVAPVEAPRPVAPAVPLETLREEAAAARQPQASVNPDQISPDALATSPNPEELLATEKDFK